MKIIVPYTYHGNSKMVNELLDSYGLQAEFLKMTDEDSYWKLLCEIWDRREDVILIEHDILPWPGAVEELMSCPMNWCSFSYKMHSHVTGHTGYGIHHAFGCVRFRKQLMESYPDVWTQVESTNWRHLDAQFCYIMQRQSIIPHPHRPPVIHLHYETNTAQESQQVLQHSPDPIP